MRGVLVAIGAVDPAVELAAAGGGVAARLELVGQDRPGIVRQISGVLAAHGVNVEELTTGTESAPMSGGLLFRAAAEVSLPAGVRLETVRAELEQIAADLMVDVVLKSAN